MNIFSFFVIISIAVNVNCEYYSSTDKLKELFDYESETLKAYTEISNQFAEFYDFLYEKVSTVIFIVIIKLFFCR
jgi:hypothetical protein